MSRRKSARTLRSIVHAHLEEFGKAFKMSDAMALNPEKAARTLFEREDYRRAGARYEDLLVHVREWQARRRDCMS